MNKKNLHHLRNLRDKKTHPITPHNPMNKLIIRYDTSSSKIK